MLPTFIEKFKTHVKVETIKRLQKSLIKIVGNSPTAHDY